MATVSITPSIFDSHAVSLGKGLAFGGTTVAAIYGLNELRKYIADKFKVKAELFPEEVLMFDDYSTTKKASEEDWLNYPASKQILYGAGAVLGGYGLAELHNFLTKKEDEYKSRGYYNALEESIKENYRKRFLTNNGTEMDINTFKLSKKSCDELTKIAADKEINEFLDSYLDKCAEDEDTDVDLTGKSTPQLAWDLLVAAKDAIVKYMPNVAPYAWGGLMPLGGIMGWKAGEHFMGNGDEDPAKHLKAPSVLYTFKRPIDDVMKEYAAKGLLDNKDYVDITRPFKKSSSALSSLVSESLKKKAGLVKRSNPRKLIYLKDSPYKNRWEYLYRDNYLNKRDRKYTKVPDYDPDNPGGNYPDLIKSIGNMQGSGDFGLEKTYKDYLSSLADPKTQPDYDPGAITDAGQVFNYASEGLGGNKWVVEKLTGTGKEVEKTPPATYMGEVFDKFLTPFRKSIKADVTDVGTELIGQAYGQGGDFLRGNMGTLGLAGLVTGGGLGIGSGIMESLFGNKGSGGNQSNISGYNSGEPVEIKPPKPPALSEMYKGLNSPSYEQDRPQASEHMKSSLA